jgi:hypothetical protein
MVMPRRHLTGFRVQGVYSPAVIRALTRPLTELGLNHVPRLWATRQEAEDGRGLGIVARLAARWGWRQRGGQTMTWFEMQALLQPVQHSAVSGKGLNSPDVDVSRS